jgi:membrane protein DedA with SNARE-associated domain
MNAFQEFAVKYAVYGYPVLFFGVLLENAGLPVPGETAVLVAGFLASPAGGGHFNILLVILLATVAAIIGDNFGFWLGERWARPRLQQGRGFLFLTPKTLQLAEGYFNRYGIWTIFFARFITGLRVVAALAAGTAGMHWTKFFIANAAGALTWATAMSLLGYFFGHSWDLLHKWLGRGALIILGCLIVAVGLPLLLRHLRRLPGGIWQNLARVQIWQGIFVAVLEVVCIALLVLQAQGAHPSKLDERIQDWVAQESPAVPFLNSLAATGSVAGTFPMVAAVTALTVAVLLLLHRSWREIAAALWALLGSEAIGFILLVLLRSRDIEPAQALVWPFGFAGLVPLRAMAVFGMTAALIRLLNRGAGMIAGLVAAVLILLAGFSVVWRQEQIFTEVLLEYAAGGVILFIGIWWLEGLGSGLLPFSRLPSER